MGLFVAAGIPGIGVPTGLLGDTVGVVPVLNGQAALYLLAGLVAVATLSPRRERYPRTSKRAHMPLV